MFVFSVDSHIRRAARAIQMAVRDGFIMTVSALLVPAMPSLYGTKRPPSFGMSLLALARKR